MKSNQKVLVVGTTPDYIEWIRQACPGRALFLTDTAVRKQAEGPHPNQSEEVVARLDDYLQARANLRSHLQRWHITLNGIACFDCESLTLAAMLAREFSLPYPTVESIRLCRDKYSSKILWQQNSVKCPQVRLAQSPDDVFDFMQELKSSCVIKPLTGSGSELVFACHNTNDCEKWAAIILKELKSRQQLQLYSDATSCFLVEEFINGKEYSCDCIVRNEGVEIIRLTQKIHSRNRPFGTIKGYALCQYPTEAFSSDILEQTLYDGAKSLGLSHAICMVDFLVCDDGIFLLEMTPRLGGDCIPHLLRCSGTIDALVMALDFAQERPLSLPMGTVNGEYVGLRLHSRKPGQIVKIDTRKLEEDSRIKKIHLIRKAGHLVVMPPRDYDSWYLGHIIFQATKDISVEDQCHELSEHLVVQTSS